MSFVRGTENTIPLFGVIEVATGEFMLDPPFVAGDVMISIDGSDFVNTSNLPTVRVDGHPELDLILTASESDGELITVRIKDQGNVWSGPSLLIRDENIATIVNQLAILNKLAKSYKVPTEADTPTHINITRGDAYDDVAWPKKSWNAGKDVDGKTWRFTLRKVSDDSVVVATSGTCSGELAEVELTSVQTNLLEVSEGFTDEERKTYKFDVEIEHSPTSFQTFRGTATVHEDQTRR